jgi:hypothetical protein
MTSTPLWIRRRARKGLFRAEPTSVLGVAALLETLAYNDEGDSPIEMYINRAWEP